MLAWSFLTVLRGSESLVAHPLLPLYWALLFASAVASWFGLITLNAYDGERLQLYAEEDHYYDRLASEEELAAYYEDQYMQDTMTERLYHLVDYMGDSYTAYREAQDRWLHYSAYHLGQDPEKSLFADEYKLLNAA